MVHPVVVGLAGWSRPVLPVHVSDTRSLCLFIPDEARPVAVVCGGLSRVMLADHSVKPSTFGGDDP